jgi:hypothetical protein
VTRLSIPVSRRFAITMLLAAPLCAAHMSTAGTKRKVAYDVPLIAQTTAKSCWAAAIAMIVSWATGKRLTPLDIATQSDRVDQYTTGILPLDGDFFSTWNMVTEAPQTYTADGFMDLLETFGPIWIAAMVDAPHVRVVTAFDFGSSDPYQGFVTINDPLDHGAKSFQGNNRGSRYLETYTKLAIENEDLGSADLMVPSLDSPRLYPVYFAHLRNKPHS